MTDEIKPRISFPPPSERVIKFLEAHPKADWQDQIEFIADNFPQIKDGQLQWLLYGSAAIALLLPEQLARSPKDTDIVTWDKIMTREFINSRIFDVKTIQDWFQLRGLSFTPEKGKLLFDQNIAVPFRGKPLKVFNPLALIVSKSFPWFGQPDRREQDTSDINLLQVSPDQVKSFIAQLKDT